MRPSPAPSATIRALALVAAALVPGVAALAGGEAPHAQMQAAAAHEAKQYARCVDVFEATAAGVDAVQGNLAPLYASCLGASGRPDEAVRFLDRILSEARVDLTLVRDKDDPGFVAIRESPGWPGLLARGGALRAQREVALDRPLRDELLARLQRDQLARQSIINRPDDRALTDAFAGVDRDNTAWLKRVVAQGGWPGASRVGDDGASAAFLLVQHADADPAFQAQALALLREAVSRHEASVSDSALLTDRVLRHQGKPQRYGTQFETGDDGVMRMQPVEDPARLDELRASVGQPTIADYKRLLEQTYRQRVE